MEHPRRRRTPSVTGILVGLCAVLGLCLAPGGADASPGDGPYGPYDRPVFLVISLTDDFQTPATGNEIGSPTYILEVGTYVAGPGLADTRYVGLDLDMIDLSQLPFPPEDLDENQVTVLGSVRTYGGSIHLFSPDPFPIPRSVQEAFFCASTLLGPALTNGQLPQFPTTLDLATFVFENQGPADATLDDIQDALFLTDMRLGCTTCKAEGDIFPHEPESESLFTFEVVFDSETGDPPPSRPSSSMVSAWRRRSPRSAVRRRTWTATAMTT